jgi:DNA-binding transcriptional LysR family regulator
MELYQLRSFVAVAGLGQLTRAAERLHLSQPAVSAQIKALEDELAAALFERGAAGMTLTPAGRHLLPHAERVLAAAQALLAEAQSLRGEVTGRIRLGTVGDPELTRLPDVLRRAVDCFPLLEIDVRHEVSGAAFAKVRDGELDAAFYYGGLTHPAVAALPLARLTFRVVVPAAWAERLAGADWDAIAAEPWIMTPAISTHHALATELFAAHGVVPVRQVEADHEAVISSLVAAGVGGRAAPRGNGDGGCGPRRHRGLGRHPPHRHVIVHPSARARARAGDRCAARRCARRVPGARIRAARQGLRTQRRGD